jgi:hypothetical protein
MEKNNLDSSDLARNYLADRTCDTCEYLVFSKSIGGKVFCSRPERNDSKVGYAYTGIAKERTCEFWDWKG